MIALPELPYTYDALEPVISAKTMQVHHDRHHAKYVATINTILGDSEEDETLEAAIQAARASDDVKLLQNAGQAWNHAFFWNAMTAVESEPTGPLLDAIVAAYGDVSGLRKAFVDAGSGHFGSGWVGWSRMERSCR